MPAETVKIDFGAEGLRWFVATGAPRSGTTMLGRLLNTHPQIGCLSEVELPKFLADLQPLFAENDARVARHRWMVERSEVLFDDATGEDLFPAAMRTMADKLQRAVRYRSARDDSLIDQGISSESGALDRIRHASKVARAMVEIALNKTGLTCIGGKVPNLDPLAAAEQLAELLPDLRVIMIARKPSDVVNSSLGRLALAKLDADVWHITSLVEACNEWRLNWNRIAVAKKALGDRLLLIKYEDLVNGRTDVGEAITRHLGLIAQLDLSICRALPEELKGYALAEEEVTYVESAFQAIDEAWDAPLEDVVKQFPSVALPMPVDGVIDFSLSGTGHLYCAEGGFSIPEPWGTWTLGRSARLDLSLGARPGDLILTIDAQVWRRDSLAFGFIATAGLWREAVTIEPAPPGQYHRKHLLIPRAALPDPSRLHLTLHVLLPKTPEEEPSAEMRSLGLGLQRLRIDFLDLRSDSARS